MNIQYIHRVIRRTKSIRFNQNVFIFGFFLLISTIFWFFKALNSEYYTELLVPVKYINLPDNRLQVGEAESFIKVTISAYGYQVMNYKASTIQPVMIDLKKLYLQSVPGTRNKKFYIHTNSIRDEILHVLGPNFRINKINPDSIVIELIRVVSKKIPVRKNFVIGLRKQFMLTDSVYFEPDSVRVKGLESILDTLSSVQTTNGVITDVHDSSWFEIDLEKINGTEFSENKTNCLVKAEEFTEMEFKLPVYVLNEPVGYSVKLLPSEVRILFNVLVSKYKTMSSNQFQIVADYLELDNFSNSRVLLKLNKKPAFVSNVRIYPQSVDYILERND